jgi:hypothetical protein
MADQTKDAEYVTIIETIVEDDDEVTHQWRTEDGTLIEEYRGAKRVFFVKDFEDNIYG